jgi:DNA transformation protein
MANTKTFVEHAVDLFGLVAPVQARAMFGGHGLYARGVMFALLDDDELFLKADDASRGHFDEAGCRQWVYQSPKGPMATAYYRPPDDAHENPEAMLPWGRLALEAALRAQASKAAKAKRVRKGGPAKKKAPAPKARRPR